MSDEAIVLREVGFAFRARRRTVNAVWSFSMEVARGETVALLGESGSGKSTVLSLISGVRLPTTGSVCVLGNDYAQMTPAARADFRLSHVAHIYQDFRLLPMLTAVENVMFVLRLKGFSRGPARERAEASLAAVGMERRLDHRPGELSGGEQQRVAIARAFVSEPDILLADEPTGSLDADRRDEILDLMFASLQGATIVLVTHDPAVASRAQRVVTMR